MPEEQDKEENLISHIEALRSTLLKCFVSIGILLPFMFFFSPKILNQFIKILIANNNITLNFFSPMEIFILQIKLAFLMSFICAFPYIAKKLWDFVLPALYENEKNFIRSITIVSSILFVGGVTFCLFLILPLIIKFGISFSNNNIQAIFGVSNIVNLSLRLAFTFGLMFQVPLITYFLIKLNVISYDTISSKRPYVVIILLIFSAILTPPDIVSQILLFLPTYVLFESGLFFARGFKNE